MRSGRGMVELRAGEARALVDPLRGGRLASLAIGGRELLLGAPTPEDASIGWGCFLMAPWPGRLARGRFRWRETEVRLPRTHGRHAIHGLGWSRAWSLASRSDRDASLTLDLATVGWPFGGSVRERFVLDSRSLRLEAEIEAAGPAPAALGWHPWFQRRGDVRVKLEARSTLEVDGMIPTGRELPIRGRFDLAAGPELGRRRIDAAYVGARPPILIQWPDLTLRMSFSPEPSTVVVFTPREAVCVEPQTAPPNALATGDASILGAGETLATTVTLEWE